MINFERHSNLFFMKIVYLILLAAGFYFAFIFARLIFIVSTANLTPIKQADRTVGVGPRLKYLAAGDSTAVGVGASSVEKSYTYQLTDYFAIKNTVEYHNIAVIASKTEDVVEKQLPAIIAFNPDVITISIGANDLNHLKKDARIIQNYKIIIAELTKKTNAQIYITDIAALDNSELFPWFYRNYLRYRANGINAQLLKLETERVKIINIHDFGWSGYSDLRTTFAADMFHPNDEGYKNWTNAFLSKID